METKEKIVVFVDDIFKGITLLRPQDGDILLFHIKTDDFGNIKTDIETCQKDINQISQNYILKDKRVSIIALPETIVIDSIETADRTIKNLESVIEFVKERKKMFAETQVDNE